MIDNAAIDFYGADWCGDCHRAKAALDRFGVAYSLHDIEHEDGAAEKAIAISGQQHIPVIAIVVVVVVRRRKKAKKAAEDDDWDWDPSDSHAGADDGAANTAGAIDAPTQVIDSVPSAKE